ncbi:MAG: lipoate--protein ligase [Lachnospiraceae bacterium]|nr:lipoate--protein ligase [Lachnospiraceae bacterium]
MNRIIISGETDPYFNLALEEELLYSCAHEKPAAGYSRKEDTVLYLWQNKNTVVIGRNQNPYSECCLDYLRRNNICLARRLSGGGAVYHDLGNLNYTFLAPSHIMDRPKQTQVICRAVEALGIPCCFSGRNDLLYHGRKFSGQAFYTDDGASYHHGTILVQVDLDTMEMALRPSPVKLSSKGITSVKSRVVNLADIRDGLDIGMVAEAVINSFRDLFGSSHDPEPISRSTRLPAAYETYSSSLWTLGNCPSYSASMDIALAGGIFRVEADVRMGVISRAIVYSDVLEKFDGSRAGAALEGCLFQEQEIRNVLECV